MRVGLLSRGPAATLLALLACAGLAAAARRLEQSDGTDGDITGESPVRQGADRARAALLALGPAQPRSARSTRAGTAIVVAVDLLDGGHAR